MKLEIRTIANFTKPQATSFLTHEDSLMLLKPQDLFLGLS